MIRTISQSHLLLIIFILAISFTLISPQQVHGGGGPSEGGGNSGNNSTTGNSNSGRSFFGGYTSIGDMFNGGGPGASGSRSGGNSNQNNAWQGGSDDRDNDRGASSISRPDSQNMDIDLIPTAAGTRTSENKTIFSGSIKTLNSSSPTPGSMCKPPGMHCDGTWELTDERPDIDNDRTGMIDCSKIPTSLGPEVLRWQEKCNANNDQSACRWECVEDSRPKECPEYYDPVCGIKPSTCDTSSDVFCNAPPENALKTTYSNKCFMEVANATILHEGTCEEPSGDVLGSSKSNKIEGDKDTMFPVVANTVDPDSVGMVAITNTLLLDHSCDGSVDLQRDFRTTYKRSDKTTNITSAVENVPEGNHCFAFKVDIGNDIKETDEQNNQTGWKKFDLGGVTLPDIDPPFDCPLYMPPECSENEILVAGEPREDGCAGPPQCVPITTGDTQTDAGPADITFETKVYSLGSAGGDTPPIKILKHDWTPEDILYLDETDVLYFRWDASPYTQCLVDLNPKQYSFSGDVTRTTGNTEEEGVEVHTLQTSYGVDCIKAGSRNEHRKDVVIYF